MTQREDRYWRQFERDAPELERQLLEEFGPPEQVIAKDIERNRTEYVRLHGAAWMDSEQADWEQGRDGD